jgi:hypothetical protein
LGIASAVAGEANQSSIQAASDGALDAAAEPNLAAAIIGNWLSDERQTAWGPMRFEFRFGVDTQLDVMGTTSSAGTNGVYERHGAYRLTNAILITPALNEGEPVRISLRDDQLTIKIDDTLEFRLKRRDH